MSDTTEAKVSETPRTQVASQSVLVVEDEALVALDLEEMLYEIGFGEVVVCNSVDTAASTLDERDFEFAVFDLNLDGETSLPLIETVMTLDTQIVVASGYDAKSVPLPDPDIARLTKPYGVGDLRRALLGD